MSQYEIEEIGIDTANRLYVKPVGIALPYIYREAMEVHWDQQREVLYGAPPRDWSHFRWFKQIIAAAKEQNCSLCLKKGTKWVDIPSDVKDAMIQWCSNPSD